MYGGGPPPWRRLGLAVDGQQEHGNTVGGPDRGDHAGLRHDQAIGPDLCRLRAAQLVGHDELAAVNLRNRHDVLRPKALGAGHRTVAIAESAHEPGDPPPGLRNQHAAAAPARLPAGIAVIASLS